MFPCARLMLCLFLAASTHRYVAGQGHYCCSPDSWESTMAHLGSGSGVIETDTSYISYDYTNKRIAVSNIGGTSKGDFHNVKIIVDYTGKKQWSIDFKGQRCKKYNITSEMRKDCVKEGRFLGVFDFGLGTHKLQCNGYALTKGPYEIYLARTQDDCVLVNAAVLAHNATAGMQTSTQYNVTPGIKDPAVFSPPSFCSGAENTGGEPDYLKNFGSYQVLKELFIQ